MNIDVKVAATNYSSIDSIVFNGLINGVCPDVKPNILFRKAAIKEVREFSLIKIRNNFTEIFHGMRGIHSVLDPHPSLLIGVLRQVPLENRLVLIGGTTFFNEDVECHICVDERRMMKLIPISQITVDDVVILEKTR